MANDDPVVARLAAIEAKLDILLSGVQGDRELIKQHGEYISRHGAEYASAVAQLESLKCEISTLRSEVVVLKTSHDQEQGSRKTAHAVTVVLASLFSVIARMVWDAIHKG